MYSPYKRESSPRTRIALGLAAAALLLAVALGAFPVASAGSVSKTLRQFSGGLNDTTLSFGSCITSDNSTSFTLPWDANVTWAEMYVYWGNYSNSSNVTGWVRSDVGDDGSVEENVTFSDSAWMNLTALGFNRYLDNENSTSGNVTVPLLLESCPPAGGWDLTFYSVYLTYTLNVSSNTSAPQFSGPIRNETLKVNTSGYSNAYLPWYFSDGDDDALTYDIVESAPSDPGWSNVTVSVSNDYLYYTSVNGWLGNLSFRVDATDPANQTASSNNVTLEVYANLAPVFSFNLTNESLLVNTSAYLWYLPSYVYDPDASYNGSNATLSYTIDEVDAADSGWSNVTLSISSSYVYAQSSNGWLGNLSFRVTATDDGGLSATSNDVTLTIRDNAAPELVGNVSDIELEMESYAYLWLWGVFEEPDRESMTLSIVESDPNATGWTYITIDASGGNSSSYILVSHSGNWAGNVSLRLRASDPGGRSADSNEFRIYVRSWPEWFFLIPAQTIFKGLTNYSEVDLTQHFRDLDQDTLTYTVWESGSGGGGGGGNNSSNLTALAYNPIYFVVNGTHLDIGSNDTSWTGSASYFVEACDPTYRCAQSNDFRVSVVAPPNAAPTFAGAIPDIYLVQGTTRAAVFNLASYFGDADGDPLSYGIQRVNASDPAWAFTSVVVNGTRIDVRSTNSSWSGTLSLFFYARDPYLDLATSNEVTIHVLTQDRPPVFAGSIADLSMVGGSTLVGAFDASVYFTDPDGLPLTFSIENASASEGWLWLDFAFVGSRLDITSRDDDGWTGAVCFVVRATDVVASTADSNLVCVTLTAPPNSPPVQLLALPGLSVPAGAGATGLLNLSLYFTDDRYAHRLAYSIVKGPEPGWSTVDLTVVGGELSVVFLGPTPPAALTYRVTVTDLRGASITTAPADLSITGRPGNELPLLSAPPVVYLEVATTKIIQLEASDANGDTLRFTVEGLVAGLGATVNAANLWLELTHSSPDEHLTATLTIVVEDGWGGRAAQTVQVASFDPARLPQITAAAQSDRAGLVWVNGTLSVRSWPPGPSVLPAVTILVDSASSYTAAASSGAYSFQLPTALSPGEHTVDVSFTDGFGRSGAAHTRVTVLEPPAALPTLVAIAVNGAVTAEVLAGPVYTFSVSASAPLASEVSVTWFVDGIQVGTGRQVDLSLAPGPHTVEARVTNGLETQSLTAQITATGQEPPGPDGDGGSSFALLAGVAAAGAGLSIVAAAWFLARRRK